MIPKNKKPMKKKISPFSRLLLIVAAVALSVSLFVPIWNIYLDAPQYPEGLRLQIWAGKISGDVDIINGLNHYIGMKTLHTNDFIEFTVLPYIIIAFAVLFLVAALVGKRKGLYGTLAAFVLFGIVAMADFWKWEYDYGHKLNPDAAIKVPGMAYQPPLIGFKQLLNFGAYSIPAMGGWLFVAAGGLLVIAVLIEIRSLKKMKSTIAPVVLLAVLLSFSSCSNDKPQPINLNKDHCGFCQMSISDAKFATELITAKGRLYKFDDIGCMLHFAASLDEKDIRKFYVSDLNNSTSLLDATTAWYVHHESLHSPMNGNTAAFPNEEAAKKLAEEYQTTLLRWQDLDNITHPKTSPQQ